MILSVYNKKCVLPGLLVSFIAALLASNLSFAQVASTANYTLQAYSINSGGDARASSSYSLSSNLGQVGSSSETTSNKYRLLPGFMPVIVSVDSDADGLSDYFELVNSLNPKNDQDASQDKDSDGLTNLQEYNLGLNINLEDTDGDGFTDKEEVDAGTNPIDGNDMPRRSKAWRAVIPFILNQ